MLHCQKTALQVKTKLLVVAIVLQFSSCSFHHLKFQKFKDGHPERLESDHQSYREVLNLPAEKMKKKTGIYLLEKGGESLLARLWFFEHAQRSIDIQYYSFYNDVTGSIASDHLVRAADRGVKIRILIDDAASRMNSHEIRLLDSHDHIEIRVYNAGLKLGKVDRRLRRLTRNYDRMLRRMHNKTLTIDGEVCFLGGRNIADRYFDYDKEYNFRDREVLMLGKAVGQVCQSFEEFWNSELTLPYSKLSGKLNKKKYKDPARFDDLHHYASGTGEFLEETRQKIRQYPGQFKRSSDNELLWLEQVIPVSDKPGKNEDREKRTGGNTTDSLMALIKGAKKQVLIESPYIITTRGSEALLKETVERGVSIKMLTNSLASTDNYAAFSSYQKCRKKILQLGTELHEFKPASALRYKLMLPDMQEKTGYKAVFGFHPKTILIDSSTAAIGSYNFDPRSANYNTEIIVIIRSEELVNRLLKSFEEETGTDNSWGISKNSNADRYASLSKRWKSFVRRVIPKKLV